LLIVELQALAKGGGGGVENTSGGGSSSLYSHLSPLDKSYKLVVNPTGTDCSSGENDSASLGSGAFGEVLLMRGKFDGKLYAVKWIRVKKAEQHNINKRQML
jgi:hypothetical protein